MATYNAKRLTLIKHNDLTNEDDEYIIDPLQGNTAAVMDINASIAKTDWTLSNGVYTYTWSNIHVTPNCAVSVGFKDGVRDGLVGDLGYSKSTGSVIFTTDEPPIGTVALVVRIIDANVSDTFPISADLVETEAITGVTNVEDALEDLDQRIAALPTVSGTDNGKIMQVANGSWAAVEMPSSLPSVSSTDNGKFLQVVNGVWAAVTIPNASGVSF